MYNTVYYVPMEEISITEAREKLSSVIDAARHNPVYLLRRNKRVAAVVDADILERLLEDAEELADIQAAERAEEERNRLGDELIPWEEVKRELGL